MLPNAQPKFRSGKTWLVEASDEARAVIEAFEDGRFYLLTHEHRYHSGFAGHVRARHYVQSQGETCRTVHVMSKPAGGEIRGYIQIGHGALLLRTPASPLDWPELDEQVSRRMGLPIVASEGDD